MPPVLKKILITLIITALSVSVLLCMYDSISSMSHHSMHNHESNIPAHIEHASLLTLATIPTVFILIVSAFIFFLIKVLEILSIDHQIQKVYRFYSDEYILAKQKILFRCLSNPRSPPNFS